MKLRIAPSPTGQLHIGNARTALFNWLYAKANNGTFLVRIDDTDTERSTKEFQKDITNVSVQHLQERTTGFTDSGRGYQNKETQTFSVNAVKDASKKVGKLQQNVVGQFIKDIKQGKYDAMDLVRSIKTTPLGDASFSKKEFFLSLFDLIKKRTR